MEIEDRVLVLSDGSGQWGVGNLLRSQEIVRVLNELGFDAEFVVNSCGAAHFVDALTTPSQPNYAAALVDVPYSSWSGLERCGASSDSLIFLDEYTDRGPFVAINLDVTLAPPARSVFAGLEYSVIRKELQSSPALVDYEPFVLVLLGGGDFSGMTESVVNSIRSTYDYRVVVIQGPNDSRVFRGGYGIRILESPDHIGSWIRAAALVVTTGGTACLEALYFEKPVHVIPRTVEEKRFAGYLMDQGLVVGIGASLAPPVSKAKAPSREETKIDGRGAQRIVEVATRAMQPTV